jgi:hypothetical protein
MSQAGAGQGQGASWRGSWVAGGVPWAETLKLDGGWPAAAGAAAQTQTNTNTDLARACIHTRHMLADRLHLSLSTIKIPGLQEHARAPPKSSKVL